MKSFSTIILLFLLTQSSICFAQNGSFTGMGNASIMLYDYWALYNNQAGLSDIKSPQMGVSYENNYMMWETGKQAFGFVLPTEFGNFFLATSRYGYSDYAENNIGIGYARNLGKYFSASIQFDYLFYSQAHNYGYKGAILLQTGIIAKPIKNMQIGFHIYNPAEVVLEDYNDKKVPTIVRFGISYLFNKQVLLSIESEKDIDNENRFKAGLQYEAIDNLFIRTGYLTSPNQFSLGLGYVYKKLTTDIAFYTHESLPISSQISFKYTFQ
jgi:hypothetical protein